jgi:hypothetical protein
LVVNLHNGGLRILHGDKQTRREARVLPASPDLDLSDLKADRYLHAGRGIIAPRNEPVAALLLEIMHCESGLILAHRHNIVLLIIIEVPDREQLCPGETQITRPLKANVCQVKI